jgi:hypothetical protein
MKASKTENNMGLTIEWPFLTSRISQRSIRTAIPIVITVKIPFTFEPQVNAMKVPVAISQPHHSVENSLSINEHNAE